MYYDLLAYFIEQSSDWSTLKRGGQVLQHSSQLLKELFNVDSGFFVYKKRIPSAINEPVQIYCPWGKFEGEAERLQASLDSHKPQLREFFQNNNEKWLAMKDIPFQLAGVPQAGMWKMTSRGEVIGALVLARSVPGPTGDEHVISMCAKQISLILDMFLAWRAADELSRYDSLTGVLNRRGIFEIFDTMVSNAERSGSSLLIGLMDIDDFKLINDIQGHPVGDRMLIEVASTLKTATRTGDVVGRLGGDEFVLLMQTSSEDTEALEDRIEELFPHGNCITVSVGFAVWKIDGDTWDECYKAADQRLFSRKSRKKQVK